MTWVDDGENSPWEHWRVEYELVHFERDIVERNRSVNEDRSYVERQIHNGEFLRSGHGTVSPINRI